MADELVKKRITEYGTEVMPDDLDNSDVIFVDSTQHGTRKLRLKGIRDIISGIQNEGIKSSGVSVTADNYAATITNVDNQPVNTIYAYAAGLQSNIANLPSNAALNILHYTYKYSVSTNVGQVQIAIERSGENPAMYFRTTGGTPVAWGSWVKMANNADLDDTKADLEINAKIARLLLPRGYQPLPCFFAVGSYSANSITPPYVNPKVQYRVITKNHVEVDEDTIFYIKNGFKVRRYWFNRSSGAWETFDSKWYESSVLLTPDKSYLIIIARVNEDQTETPDVAEFGSAIYSIPVGASFQACPTIGINSTDYSSLLSNIDFNCIFSCSSSDGWNDKPYTTGIFESKKYTPNYSVQEFSQFATPSTKISRTWRRIINTYSHSVYSDWMLIYSSDETFNILALGDSICRGGRNSGKGFVGDLGFNYINMGVGGATLSSTHSAYSDSIHKFSDADNIPNQLVSYNTKSEEQIQTAFGKSKFVPDAIIAEGGINDYIKSAVLGSLSSDIINTDEKANLLDRNTVVGALEYLFFKMIELYPKAQRYFVIAHKTGMSDSVYYPTRKCSAGYNQTELHDAIITCCEKYNVVPIDVFNCGVMNTGYTSYRSSSKEWTDASADDYCDHDGVHPLSYGYLHAYKPLILDALSIATKNKSY